MSAPTTTDLSGTSTVAGLEAKIDALTEQVSFLAAEAMDARMRRESWTELSHDVMPVAGDFLEMASRELDELSADVEFADFTELLRRLVRVAPTLTQTLGYLEMFSELATDLSPLTEQMMDLATDRLVDVDAKGYFAFAGAGLKVVDKVVTNYSEDDVTALGDNVVLMLDTIKELTQPEIMAVLHEMIGAVHRQQVAMAAEPAAPPSFFELAKRLRDPELRRGLGRAIDTLSAVSTVDPTGRT